MINSTAEELSEMQAVVNCELPNNMTSDFSGSVGAGVGVDGRCCTDVWRMAWYTKSPR